MSDDRSDSDVDPAHQVLDDLQLKIQVRLPPHLRPPPPLLQYINFKKVGLVIYKAVPQQKVDETSFNDCKKRLIKIIFVNP